MCGKAMGVIIVFALPVHLSETGRKSLDKRTPEPLAYFHE